MGTLDVLPVPEPRRRLRASTAGGGLGIRRKQDKYYHAFSIGEMAKQLPDSSRGCGQLVCSTALC